MLATLIFTSLIARPPQTFDLTPTDDVWVYPHASDPEKDPFLRAWGAGGKSVAATPDEGSDFSYSYLKWDMAALPKQAAKFTEAKLVVTLVANPGFAEDDAKANPLEARPVKATFSEKGWDWSKSATLAPSGDSKAAFGTAYPKGFKMDGKEIKLSIDLLKGPGDFAKYVKDALASGDPKLALALTSAIDPSVVGRSSIYKMYSKDAEKKELRPVLHLVVE